MSNLEPAGGILSNANDMAKWIRFNLRNGSTHTGQQLIDKELLLEAWQVRSYVVEYTQQPAVNK